MGILRKNRPFFFFLLRFAVGYIVLSGLYWLYLSGFDAAQHEPDGMTYAVARQSQLLIGSNASIAPHPSEASYRFFVHGKSVVRIVEGCNGISVMILFAAFTIAFASTFKRTLVFTLGGIIIIHILNIVRIALLALGFYNYPQYSDLLHEVFFPLFIYGVVFGLWLLWVFKFSGYAAKAKN